MIQSDEEIRAWYRMAADPEERIQIMADMNECTTRKIKQILGIIPHPQKKRERSKISLETKREVVKMLQSGLSLKQVSVKTGIDRSTVHEIGVRSGEEIPGWHRKTVNASVGANGKR